MIYWILNFYKKYIYTVYYFLKELSQHKKNKSGELWNKIWGNLLLLITNQEMDAIILQYNETFHILPASKYNENCYRLLCVQKIYVDFIDFNPCIYIKYRKHFNWEKRIKIDMRKKCELNKYIHKYEEFKYNCVNYRWRF